MKNTKQKELIFQNVKSRFDHPSAEDVYHSLKCLHPTLSLATVYRNLNQFSESGMIRKIEIPNASDRFDGTMESHDHAICLTCGKVVDIPSQITKKPKSIKVEGFKVQEIQFLALGQCQECQEAKKQFRAMA